MAISMLKIRRPLGRLIFNMGIAIPGKTVFLIETAPRIQRQPMDSPIYKASDAALPEMPVKFQNDTIIITSNLGDSRHHEILG